MANHDGAAQTDGGMWMVRAGRGGVEAARFLEKSIVAIGWGNIGEASADSSDDEIRRLMDMGYPDAKPGSRRTWAGTVRRFVKEVEVGDPVVTYDNESRMYHLGEIRSDAERVKVDVAGEERWEFHRNVEWQDRTPRDSLLLDTRNRLGGILSVFRVPAAASADLRRRALKAVAVAAQDDESPPSVINETETDESDTIQEYIEKSGQYIEDAISKLDWEQIQELVAGIIRAMGYKTKVASPGPDQGVDIFASPDGLGFAEPRIFVEVKHQAGSIGAPAIRSFIGGRLDGDRCLYVSTGGFSREARYEAARTRIRLTLINMSDLRNLLVDYYETLDSDTRALVPLKRVYLPVSLSDS